MRKTSTTVSTRAATEQQNQVGGNTHRLTRDSYASIAPLGSQVEEVQYHPPNNSWPSVDVMRTMPFDYSINDPRYDDASPVYCPGFKLSAEGTHS